MKKNPQSIFENLSDNEFSSSALSQFFLPKQLKHGGA